MEISELQTNPKESKMTKPTVADKKPMSVNLDAGDHYWCACGKSSNQPFCDGSHRGTDFTP